jgi:hypothetical protein
VRFHKILSRIVLFPTDRWPLDVINFLIHGFALGNNSIFSASCFGVRPGGIDGDVWDLSQPIFAEKKPKLVFKTTYYGITGCGVSKGGVQN